MHFDPSRREILGGGLFLGAILLAGCQPRQKWTPMTPEALDGPAHVKAPPKPLPLPRADLGAPEGVIPRSEWTRASPNFGLINPMGSVTRMTVHHDGMPPVPLRTKTDVALRLEVIRRAHIFHSPPWADIGYHYIIDPQGRIWEGRPAQYQGAHVKNNNEHNLSVMLLGNFDEQRPTPDALDSLDAFLADRMKALRIPLSRLYTHQEINPTACPGRSLQAYMKETRAKGGRLARML